MAKIYYLGVRFSRSTECDIGSVRAALGLADAPEPKLGYHTTIAYSRKPFRYHIDPLLELPRILSNSLAFFGSSLVLVYDCPWLQAQHEIARDYGAIWDHDGYHPHITIAEEQTEVPVGTPFSIEIKIREIFYREYH